MSQLPIAYVDIRFCAYATEDIDKVMDAVHNILPSNEREKLTFNKSYVEGHYGNPITFFETRIKDKETINALIENLSTNLNSLDRKALGKQINRYVEKGSFYIRLNKQSALQGKIKFAFSDPIRVRIRFKISKIDDIIEVCKEIGMI